MTLKLPKKSLYTVLSIFICCCFAAADTYAQVNLTLLQGNITGQTNQTFTGVLVGAIGGATDIKASSTNSSFTASAGTGTLALSTTFLKPNQVGSISLSGITPYFQLVQSPPSQFYSGLGLLGNVTADFRITMAGTPWVAGTYTTPLVLTQVTPSTQALNIIVPSFIAINTAPTLATLNVTALANYRAGGGVSTTQSFDYFTSMAADVKLKATTVSNFSFSTTTPKIVDPSPAASLLKAHTTVPSVGSQISLTNADQSLATNIAVPLTNKTSITTQFSISAADLSSSFVQAGTYTLPLTYTVSKNTAAFGTATTVTSTSSVQVVVPRLFEFLVQTNDVLFNINTISAYTNGLTTAMPNPIVLSSTVPYNITVKASGDFSNGSGGTIPANTMTVEGISTETGVSSVALTNLSQNIVSGAAPVIDRNLRLQYRISAAQAANLLGKTAGLYQNTITFTCTAP